MPAALCDPNCDDHATTAVEDGVAGGACILHGQQCHLQVTTFERVLLFGSLGSLSLLTRKQQQQLVFRRCETVARSS